MNFLKRIFGKAVEPTLTPASHYEKASSKKTIEENHSDEKNKKPLKEEESLINRGDRHDHLDQAVIYWTNRMTSVKKDPYVMFTFDKEEDAHDALLELPCIHQGEDKKLICTEYLIYGYYQQTDGRYEAVICGEELSHELWEKAKVSFEKHHGKIKNDLEPEIETQQMDHKKVGHPEKVHFIRQDVMPSPSGNATCTYRIHKGPDAESARAFLEKNPVTKDFFYLVVETPEGNFGRDINGIYKE